MGWLVVLGLLPTLLFGQFPSGAPGGLPNSAQLSTGRFYGKVVDDAAGKGLGYASVQLLGMRFDSVTKAMQPTLITGQLTAENGDFSLENVPVRGEFNLKITYLGYGEIEQKVSFGRPDKPADGAPGMNAGAVEKDLGNIRLATSSQMLKEVTVTGEAAQVTLALDRKIYRVDKDGVAAGGTAEDAMKNIPSLNVDIDGNLTLRNSAPQVFVDGRPTLLSLDQIPADAIDNVEVITNPSAKYDASGGNAGIVNIVLKKDRKVGYNGSVRTGVDMRGRFNLGGDLNVRQGKINTFVSGNLNQRRSLSTGGTDRQNLFGMPRTNVFQTSDSENKGYFASGRAGLDWFVNNRNTFTVAGNYTTGGFNSTDDLRIRTDTVDASSSLALRHSDSHRMFQNFGGQLLFKHLFPKEGKELTADLNYNGAHFNNDGLFNTDYENSSLRTRQRQAGKGINNFLTVQTDFVHPLTSNMKLELGARAALRDYQSENENYQFNFVDDQYVRAPGFADRYKFEDRVAAAYGTFSHSFPKWGYQLGLRAESSRYTGTLLDVDSTFRNEYPLSLFPSLFLTYKLNDDDNVQLSYTRRVNRPNFFNLIPFYDFSDSLLLSRGNPGLRPEFTNSFELQYQNIFVQGHNLLTSVYYKRATDQITRYQFAEFNDLLQRDVIVSSYANSSSSIAYGLEFTLKNTFFKIVELTSNFNFYNSVVDAQNIERQLKVEQFTWFAKENLAFKLPQAFTIQFSGSYQSRTSFSLDGGGGGGGRGGGGFGGGPSNTAQGYSIPVGYVDLSLRKDLWKRKGSLTLNVQDIFRSRRNGSHSESAFFVQDTWRRRDPQLVRLNFSYRFGKFDTSLFRRKNNRVEEGGDS